MTLRIHNPIAKEVPVDRLVIGYPIIDTPDFPGLICDRHIGEHVPKLICNLMGFPYGEKLPIGGLYGNPSGGQTLSFVLDRISCSGSEGNFFECNFGPWGQHQCEEEDILSVICSKEEGGKFKPSQIVKGLRGKLN